MLGKLTYKTKEDDVRAKDLLLNMYNIIFDYNRTQSLIGFVANCKKALEIDPSWDWSKLCKEYLPLCLRKIS